MKKVREVIELLEADGNLSECEVTIEFIIKKGRGGPSRYREI